MNLLNSTDFTLELGSGYADDESAFKTRDLIERGYRAKYEFCSDLPAEDVLTTLVAALDNPTSFSWDGGTLLETGTVHCKVNGAAVELHSTTEHEIIKILSKCGNLFKKRSNSFSVDYYYLDHDDITYNCITLSVDEIEDIYPELYPQLDIAMLAEDYCESSDKILILHGMPGIGKTSFIRYLLYHHISENEICYVKDPEVLKNSTFWATMANENYDYIILDDIGSSIAPRKKNKSAKDDQFVSEMLSYSSGILEQNSSKIIMTTNLDVGEIDEALLRPGRCFDFITLQPLVSEQAQLIWESRFKMTEESFKQTFGKKETITQADLISSYKQVKSHSQIRRYMIDGTGNESITDRIKAIQTV
jgi:GTPase SAR1 family protein